LSAEALYARKDRLIASGINMKLLAIVWPWKVLLGMSRTSTSRLGHLFPVLPVQQGEGVRKSMQQSDATMTTVQDPPLTITAPTKPLQQRLRRLKADVVNADNERVKLLLLGQESTACAKPACSLRNPEQSRP
jgi:hypothetical protein